MGCRYQQGSPGVRTSWLSGFTTPVATIDAVTRLSVSLVSIRLRFDGRSRAKFSPGCKVKLRTAEGPYRSYTPSRWAADGQWFEVVIFTHGGGPGSRIGEYAQVGQTLEVRGPARSLKGLDTDLDWIAFFGDESALGLAVAIAPVVNGQVAGAIELAAEDSPAIAAVGLGGVTPVTRTTRGTALVAAASELSLPPGRGSIVLSGHAGSVDRLKTHFSPRLPEEVTLAAKPYWARPKDRRRGHPVG